MMKMSLNAEIHNAQVGTVQNGNHTNSVNKHKMVDESKIPKKKKMSNEMAQLHDNPTTEGKRPRLNGNGATHVDETSKVSQNKSPRKNHPKKQELNMNGGGFSNGVFPNDKSNNMT